MNILKQILHMFCPKVFCDGKSRCIHEAKEIIKKANLANKDSAVEKNFRLERVKKMKPDKDWKLLAAFEHEAKLKDSPRDIIGRPMRPRFVKRYDSLGNYIGTRRDGWELEDHICLGCGKAVQGAHLCEEVD